MSCLKCSDTPKYPIFTVGITGTNKCNKGLFYYKKLSKLVVSDIELKSNDYIPFIHTKPKLL